MPHSRISELFAIHPIADVIFSYLTVTDVYKLHAVCRSLQGVVHCLQDTRLNISAALSDFVKSCDSFRWNLGKTNSLIVGGFVLDFLALRQQVIPFLDIVVEEGAPALGLIQYLCDEETYEMAGTQEHKFWPLRKLNDDFGVKLAELAQQGWTTRDLVWADWAIPPGLGVRRVGDNISPRRVGDEMSLVMPLRPALAHNGLKPDHVLELSEFSVDSPARPGGFGTRHRELSVTVKELQSPSLRYRYTTGQGSQWRTFVSERLKRWTEIEACKMDPDSRPPHWLPPPPDFEVPPTWDFADDQMPLWYKTYWLENSQRRLAS
ncbi:hypothetical protein MAA_00113 [Metarhizium robertsii ARSEF 23]|uniref:F-box domain-containing protein n=1 Tax=Metarhizium robertsii (strain ARSEF 23 / ATCC MYA-3075) TaxID=655844 RepID=E9EK28_METRA|nr:uncharacterized protein MAA_00113 [Metarhizium robertsii ARSEF 23]EFZ03039.1 hypothetical protein MAA_00113 [Metarhizium robertsii ARSEF 23]